MSVVDLYWFMFMSANQTGHLKSPTVPPLFPETPLRLNQVCDAGADSVWQLNTLTSVPNNCVCVNSKISLHYD